MATKLETSNVITLRGSVDIVTEFFHFSVTNILYQRGIYPPESFQRVPKYGLSMVQSTEEGLTQYLTNINKQLESWLVNGKVKKLVLVVKGVDTGDTLERWVFDCEATSEKENDYSNQQPESKTSKEITQEIQAIMRQITASVTFLPLLNEACKFDLLVYADKAATVPVTWEDSDPCLIAHAEEVQLRSFATQHHKVDLKVTYRVDEDGI